MIWPGPAALRAEPIDLSVVVPAYNEASRIVDTLEAVLSYLENSDRRYEVIVVNDGSTDRTAEIVSDFSARRVWLIDLNRNRGKGGAIRHGVVATRGDVVLLTDADLSTPITELDRLLPWLDSAHLVLGSRGLRDSNVVNRQPFYRETMGRVFNLIIRGLALVPFKDTQCGFKLIRGPVAREVFPDLWIDGFAYDVELVREVRRRGLEVVEVGVEWHDHPVSRVLPFTHSMEMLRDVLRLRFGRRPRS